MQAAHIKALQSYLNVLENGVSMKDYMAWVAQKLIIIEEGGVGLT